MTSPTENGLVYPTYAAIESIASLPLLRKEGPERDKIETGINTQLASLAEMLTADAGPYRTADYQDRGPKPPLKQPPTTTASTGSPDRSRIADYQDRGPKPPLKQPLTATV